MNYVRGVRLHSLKERNTETDHYLITKQFLDAPDRMMAYLLYNRI